MSGEAEELLRGALPPLARNRLQSLRFSDGVATLVLDAGEDRALSRLLQRAGRPDAAVASGCAAQEYFSQ